MAQGCLLEVTLLGTTAVQASPCHWTAHQPQYGSGDRRQPGHAGDAHFADPVAGDLTGSGIGGVGIGQPFRA
jgi:hypothetical protein